MKTLEVWLRFRMGGQRAMIRRSHVSGYIVSSDGRVQLLNKLGGVCFVDESEPEVVALLGIQQEVTPAEVDEALQSRSEAVDVDD